MLSEQKVLGERVGLIDLEDAAAGPPELDVGNLLPHLELLGLRSDPELAEVETALLDGYLGAVHSRCGSSTNAVG